MKIAASLLTLSSLSLAALALGCSSGSTASPAAASTTTDAAPSDPNAAGDGTNDPNAGDGAAPLECAPSLARKKSKCKNEMSWVRGVAHFDPSHLKAVTDKTQLRVVLRHGFTLADHEEDVGGRLHAYASMPITQDNAAKGEVEFAIDMCGLGASMWSEDNGAFHLILILDEDGNNDIGTANTNAEALVAGTPGPNELVKMVDVDISCKTGADCLDVKLDCTGASCTKISPIKSCKAKPGCTSTGGAFCTE